MFEIINSGPGGGKPPKLNAAARRKVRSHAMRYFRHEQREARRRVLGPIFDVVSEQPRLRTFQDHSKEPQSNSVQSNGKADGCQQAQDEASMPVSKMTSFDDAAWQNSLPSTEIPHSPSDAGLHQLALAELFGASLLGSGARRPRSAGLLYFRCWVAATCSDLVKATDDTVCLLLPACTLMDSRILINARKRHLVALQCMHRALESGVEHTNGVQYALATITGAIELLFVDMFKPMSLGVGSLYDGLVDLVRIHFRTLASVQSRVNGWVFVQLRQIMLIESLVSRTAMPIATETWCGILHSPTLLPEPTESLMELGVQVPALLKIVRKLLDSVTTQSATLDGALQDLLTLEHGLIRWQTERVADLSRPNLISNTQHQDFSVLSKAKAPQAVASIRCLSFVDAQCEALCQICLLLLREAIAGLAFARADQKLESTYITHATQTADRLCRLSDHLSQEADGLLSKALSVNILLYFAHQWYKLNRDFERAATSKEQTIKLQREVPFLSWRSLLPLSLPSIYMNSSPTASSAQYQQTHLDLDSYLQ